MSCVVSSEICAQFQHVDAQHLKRYRSMGLGNWGVLCRWNPEHNCQGQQGDVENPAGAAAVSSTLQDSTAASSSALATCGSEDASSIIAPEQSGAATSSGAGLPADRRHTFTWRAGAQIQELDSLIEFVRPWGYKYSHCHAFERFVLTWRPLPVYGPQQIDPTVLCQAKRY